MLHLILLLEIIGSTNPTAGSDCPVAITTDANPSCDPYAVEACINGAIESFLSSWDQAAQQAESAHKRIDEEFRKKSNDLLNSLDWDWEAIDWLGVIGWLQTNPEYQQLKSWANSAHFAIDQAFLQALCGLIATLENNLICCVKQNCPACANDPYCMQAMQEVVRLLLEDLKKRYGC